MLVQLYFILALLYPTCSVPFKYLHICVLHFFVMQVQVLSIRIIDRLIFDLQFSRFSGEPSFFEDNSHECQFSLQLFSFSFARFILDLSQYFQSSLEAYFRLNQIQLSIELIFPVFKYLSYRIWVSPISSDLIMIQLPHQFIIFSSLMIMPVGLSWDHFWFQVSCPRLGGSLERDIILSTS